MAGDEPFQTLDFTSTFLDEFSSKGFTRADRRALLRALTTLDTTERQPSLRVHQLGGPLRDLCSASASDTLRIVFIRTPDERKVILGCSKHDDR